MSHSKYICKFIADVFFLFGVVLTHDQTAKVSAHMEVMSFGRMVREIDRWIGAAVSLLSGFSTV